MLLNLDYRKKLILNTLLKKKRYLSSEELAGLAGVSSRTIRTDIRVISEELEHYGLKLNALPGRGYRIDETLKPRFDIFLAENDVAQPIAPDERMLFIIKKLSIAPVMFSEILEFIHVSESTLDKDLERCSVWLEPCRVKIIRQNNKISLCGTREDLFSVKISYYFKLSQLTGINMDSLLENDFPYYRNVKSGFQQYVAEVELTDDEFLGNLIILLWSIYLFEERESVSDSVEQVICEGAERLSNILLQHGICVGFRLLVDVAARVEVLGRRNGSYLCVRDTVSSTLTKLLVDLGAPESDDALRDGLCSIIQSFVAPGGLYCGSRITIQELETRYPEALRLAMQFVDELSENFPEKPGDFDIVRFGMCFAAFLERNMLRIRKKAALICISGIGTSQLLAAKLTRFFPNLEITGIFPLHRLSDAEASEPDFIISNVDLDSKYDVVKVGDFLNHNDFDRIIPFLRKNIRGWELFKQLSSRRMFFENIDAERPEQVIHQLCELTYGTDDVEFEKRVLEREALGATSVGNLAAIPHAVKGLGSENLISIGILENAVRWGNENVQIVFLLRIDQPEIDLAALFDYIYALISDRGFIKQVISERSYSLLLRNQEGIK